MTALVERLSVPQFGPVIAEMVASIIAHSALTPPQRTRFIDMGGVTGLLHLVVIANSKVGCGG